MGEEVNQEKSEMQKLPINIRIEKAKNEMKYFANMLCVKYDLIGPIVDLIMESALAQENQQRLSQICEQITLSNDDQSENQEE